MNIKSKYIGFVFGSFVILGSSLIQTHASVWYYSPEGEPRFHTRQDYAAYQLANEKNESLDSPLMNALSKVVLAVTAAFAFSSAVKEPPKKKRTCGIF